MAKLTPKKVTASSIMGRTTIQGTRDPAWIKGRAMAKDKSASRRQRVASRRMSSISMRRRRLIMESIKKMKAPHSIRFADLRLKRWMSTGTAMAPSPSNIHGAKNSILSASSVQGSPRVPGQRVFSWRAEDSPPVFRRTLQIFPRGSGARDPGSWPGWSSGPPPVDEPLQGP